MINLRYHIVSLTAVFLAIGIGLAVGSTFLDQATVDNLEGQLGSLQESLDNRQTRIENLETTVADATALSDAWDTQGGALLEDRLTDVPVVVLASRGANADAVRGAQQALVAAGAQVEGIWWISERFVLADDSAVTDLATLLDDPSDDPSRLRRMAIDAVGRELKARQSTAVTTPDASAITTTTTTVVDATTTTLVVEDTSDADVLNALFESGFLEFEALSGGPESPTFGPSTRVLAAGGSSSVPDDLVLEPLIERLTQGSDGPIKAVVGSAGSGSRGISDAVAVIRADEVLRTKVATVDTLAHFEGWAAMILAFDDLDSGLVGHYGLGEGASRLLPAPSNP